MRKHLYLIVEHEDDEQLGRVKLTDKTLGSVCKNERGPIHKFKEDTGEFVTVGKQVGMGYYDFDEDEYEDNDRVAEVMQQKLTEIDSEHLDAAGIDLGAMEA